MSKLDNNRFFGMDALRVLACLMVLMVHANEVYYCYGPYETMMANTEAIDWVNIYGSMLRACVPLFAALTGYFLLPVRMELGAFFKKRVSRVGIPFVLWCAVYAGFQFVMGRADGEQAAWNVLKTFVNFGTQVGHLWYVYMALGLYLFAPIISPWLEKASRRELHYFLGLWAVSLSIRYLHHIFPEMVWGEVFWNKYHTLYYFSGFMGYAVLGFYLRKFWAERTRWDLPLALVLLTTGYALTYWGFDTMRGLATDVPGLERSWYFDTLNTGMMTLGFLLLAKNLQTSSQTLQRGMSEVSLRTYGMYLSHIIFLELLTEPTRMLVGGSPALHIPLLALSTFAVSYLFTRLISYLPGSKYLC